MSLVRGGSRFFRAVKVAVAWPIQVKLEPFAEMDMTKIPAFRDTDHYIPAVHRRMFYGSDPGLYPRRWATCFCGSNHTTDYFGQAETREDASLTEPPPNPETRTAISWNSHEEAMAAKDAIEAEIRHAADPDGRYSRHLIDTAGLVKNIRKRHRDALEKNKRDKNQQRIEMENLQHRFDDEKDRLYRIIGGQNEAIKLRYEHDQEIRDDLEQLRKKYRDLRAENEVKDERIAEMEWQAEQLKYDYKAAEDDSKEALAQAARQTDSRIRSNDERHRGDMDVLRRRNDTLQSRLETAENKPPVHIFHKAQVGVVCKLLKKLLQVKEVRKEEMLAKDVKINELGTKVDQYEQEVRVLKAVANADGKKLQRTANLLSETQTRLSKSKDQVKSYQYVVTRFKQMAKVSKRDRLAESEKEALQKQLQSPAYTYDPQIQEQVQLLRTENQLLREAAAADAQTLKAKLEAQFAVEAQQLEQRFANKTMELESGFNQGFENLRALRDQWLIQKRRSEEDHYRAILTADLQHQLKHQGQEARITAICQEKEDDFQRREHDLRSREIGLALKVSNLDDSKKEFMDQKSRAEKAEEEGRQLRIAATDHKDHESSTVQNLSDQIMSLRRDGQRHLDLLNEETGKMDVFSREVDLHNELQRANCSINYFTFQVDNRETSSEVLSQSLYGADFYESDVRLLQTQERPVLLAQLQAAKKTLEGLRGSLSEGPNVNVGKARSILLAPRGDEDVAKPAEDIFDPTNKQPPSPAHQPATRKRAGVPLGAPTYGASDDNTAYDDWVDQTVNAGAKISTPDEILTRRRSQPKSRIHNKPALPLPPQNTPAAIHEL